MVVRVGAARLPVQAFVHKNKNTAYSSFYLPTGAGREKVFFSAPLHRNQKNNHKWLFLVSLVRVERIELSSQVWKTCILTTVLYPQLSRVIYVIKSRRLMVSRNEARLMGERATKTAEMQDFSRKELGWDIGIEPTTFWTTIRRSNHLS